MFVWRPACLIWLCLWILILNKDYKNWSDDFRCGLIDGVVYMMSSTNAWHQTVSMELSGQLINFFRDKGYRPFAAPFDVRLFPEDDESDDAVVQPDLMVICDVKKVSDGKACKGPPDLVIEILSDSTKSKDMAQKFDLYKRAGVREYWIAGSNVVKVCRFQPDAVEKIHDFNGSREVESGIFPGLVLKF